MGLVLVLVPDLVLVLAHLTLLHFHAEKINGTHPALFLKNR